MSSRNVIPLSIIMLKGAHAIVHFRVSLSNCIPNLESWQVDFEKTEYSELFSIDICFTL